MVMPLILIDAPSTPLHAEAVAAIFNDAQLNATIGNGNLLISWPWWYGYAGGPGPKIHIDTLTCRPHGEVSRCTFTLTRTSGEGASQEDQALVHRLSCRADLRWEQDDDGKWAWQVVHKPHPGHSRTTMKCAPSSWRSALRRTRALAPFDKRTARQRACGERRRCAKRMCKWVSARRP